MDDLGLFSFEKTRVYQQSRQLVKNGYCLMKNYPSVENYALCDQMRRSVTSVSSNIAEGLSRISLREQLRFIEIAFGSLMEYYCQLQLSTDLEYITEAQLNEQKDIITEIAKQLSGLHNYRKNLLNKTTNN